MTLRLLAIGQLLLIALVVARASYPARLRVAAPMLLLCIAAYLAAAAPVGGMRPGWLAAVLDLGAYAAPFFLWVVAHLVFERRLPGAIAILAAAGTAACWSALLLARGMDPEWRQAILDLRRGLALLLVGHAMFVALRDLGDDLSDRRRRFRIAFVLIVGLEALAVILDEAFGRQGRGAPVAMLLQSGSAVAAILLLGGLLLAVDAAYLIPIGRSVAPEDTLSPAEHVLKQKLDAALADGLYRMPGLTIGGMAKGLGVPEHRLRNLINRRLGYRNFSAFLNACRLADAKKWLADPERVDLPVLTLAMDLGYGSLAPFNRAFREETGMTPTQYRRSAILEIAKT